MPDAELAAGSGSGRPRLIAVGASVLSESAMAYRCPVPLLRASDAFELVAVYTPDAARAAAMGAYWPDLTFSSDLQQVLDTPAETVFLAVPLAGRASWWSDLGRLGLHVLGVPPWDVSCEDIAELASRFEDDGLRSMLLQPQRRQPWARRLLGLGQDWKGEVVLRHSFGGTDATRGAGSEFAAVTPWDQDRLNALGTVWPLLGVSYYDVLMDAFGWHFELDVEERPTGLILTARTEHSRWRLELDWKAPPDCRLTLIPAGGLPEEFSAAPGPDPVFPAILDEFAALVSHPLPPMTDLMRAASLSAGLEGSGLPL